MKKKIAVFIFLFASFIGVSFELDAYRSGDMTLGQYQNMGINVLLLGIYMIPIILFLRHFQKKWQVNGYAILSAVYGGAFISGWLSVYGNRFFEGIWKTIITNPDVYDTWEAAVSAPYVEELLKLAVVVFVIYIFNVRSLRGIFLSGAAVGFGFQITEDLSYVYYSVLDYPHEAISHTFHRITGSIASHWSYTALIAIGYGLFLLYRNQLNKSQKQLALVYLLSPILLHFAWNSPLSDIDTPFDLIIVIISSIQIALLFQAVQTLQEFDTQKI